MKNLTILSLGVSTIVMAACSQSPAPVAHKGNQFFGKNGVSQYEKAPQYASAAPQRGFVPEYSPPVQAEPAPLDSMQIAELSPPEPVIESKPLAAPASAPFQTYQAAPQAAAYDVEAPRAQPAVMQTARYEEELQPASPQLEPLAMENLAMDSMAVETIAAKEENPVVTAAIADAPKAALDRASNFIWPTQGKIVSHFGPKKNGLVNDGINISAGEGEPIWAAAGGEVVYAGNELKGYGNMMIIRHNNNWMTAYAHASDMLISKGDRVEQGDLIGYVGKTGAVTTAQLHFGIREDKTPVDPETLLPRRVASAD